VSPVDKPEVPRCPYCVSEGQFNGMRVLENGRQICEKCGHIVFPEDRAFWCPCQKCLDMRFSPELQKYSRAFDVELWSTESERGSRESLNRVLDNSHR
jgi:hypothetical protein